MESGGRVLGGEVIIQIQCGRESMFMRPIPSWLLLHPPGIAQPQGDCPDLGQSCIPGFYFLLCRLSLGK